ncbi:MAG: hypothetical protein HQK96_09200 [Nitrospirae bacterium]|nr:hypothetical protein [Nitrospirota bacterium]
MAELPDSTRLIDMAIPGTHDSAANAGYCFTTNGKAQNWDVATQLNNGIRFLDVRLMDDPNYPQSEWCDDVGICEPVGDSTNVIHACHGSGLTTIDLGGAEYAYFTPAINFLSSHPGETILLSATNESGHTVTLSDFYSEFVNPNSNYFYLNAVDSSTTLGQVRGKIVYFNGFSYDTSGLGTPWSTSINQQDDYNLNSNVIDNLLPNNFVLQYALDLKEAEILAWLNVASECYPAAPGKTPPNAGATLASADGLTSSLTVPGNCNLFYVNYTSANSAGDVSLGSDGQDIQQNANQQNPAVLSYFNNINGGGQNSAGYSKLGSIILMDFPDLTSGVIGSILKNSFLLCGSITVPADITVTTTNGSSVTVNLGMATTTLTGYNSTISVSAPITGTTAGSSVTLNKGSATITATDPTGISALVPIGTTVFTWIATGTDPCTGDSVTLTGTQKVTVVCSSASTITVPEDITAYSGSEPGLGSATTTLLNATITNNFEGWSALENAYNTNFLMTGQCSAETAVTWTATGTDSCSGDSVTLTGTQYVTLSSPLCGDEM